MENSNKIYIWLSWIVIALGITLRFLNLDADPPFWMDHWMADEATVVGNARNKFLFGSWVVDEVNYGLISPLLNLFIFLSLKIWGLSYFSVRFFSAFFGGSMLIIFYLLVKNYLNEKQTLIATFFISVASIYVHFSRVALGESYILFFFFVSLFFWFRALDKNKQKRNAGILCSGFFWGLSILCKLSAVIHFPIYIILWIFQWRRREIEWKDLFLFMAGFFSTLPFWGLINWATSGEWLTLVFTGGDINLPSRGSLVIHPLLNIYKTFTNLLFGTSPVLWILFACYLIWLVERMIKKENIVRTANLMELLALAIMSGGFLSTFWLHYQTEQRILPFIWAMSILGSLLITRPGRTIMDFDEIFELLEKSSKKKRFLWTALIVFPFWFFITYAGSGITEKIPLHIGTRPGISLLGLSILFLPIWILGIYFSIRYLRFWKAFCLGSFVSLALMGLSRLFLNLQLYFGIGINQILPSDLRLRQVCLLVLPLALMVFVINLRVSSNRFVIWEKTRRLTGLILVLFLGFHFWQGVYPIVHPTFSAKAMGASLAKNPQFKEVFLVSHHSPLLLSRAHLIQLNNESSVASFNINRLASKNRGTYFLNLADQIPKNDDLNIRFLNSWDKEFPLPQERKLEGVFKVCPFGLYNQFRYVLALWRS